MTTCCRISAAPRTRSAARTNITAPAARSTSPICAPATNCTTRFIAAAQEAGFKANPDFNGAEQEGVGNYQLTVRKMRRCSAALAYLRPAMKRPNLKVEIRAFAQRVLFDGRRAVGLEFMQNGALRRVRARAEVLLSGGSLLSPQLLQLSGVGPGDLLREHGIAIVHELPGVGDNLQDHLGARVIYKARNRNTLNEISRSWLWQARTGLEYVLGRRGALMMGAAPIGLFAKTREGLASPDVQYQFLAGSFDKPGEKMHPFPGCSLVAIPCRPESRGWVRIKSPDPSVPPAMQPNYLGTRGDQETMVAALKISRRIFRTPTMQRYVVEEFWPGAQVETDADLLEHAKRTGSTTFHQTIDLHDGRARPHRRRYRIARARRRGAARRRCVGDADRDFRQHQRRDDHDRRKSLRPDPGPDKGGSFRQRRAGPGRVALRPLEPGSSSIAASDTPAGPYALFRGSPPASSAFSGCVLALVPTEPPCCVFAPLAVALALRASPTPSGSRRRSD